jgi:hypothetical protein
MRGSASQPKAGAQCGNARTLGSARGAGGNPGPYRNRECTLRPSEVGQFPFGLVEGAELASEPWPIKAVAPLSVHVSSNEW